MESQIDHMDFHALRAALDWQIELGADEAICDAPLNRYEVPEARPAVVAKTGAVAPDLPEPPKIDVVAEARAMAQAAGDLSALQAALAAFDHCELKRGAKSLCFADGNPKARVMIVGEAPGREEDQAGTPFVGPAGQMLDRMFAAIGLARTAPDPAASIYVTNAVPWRPPSNREPSDADLAMMRPFLQRHIELAAPDVVIAMGNVSCAVLLGRRGITRMRGQWDEAFGIPVLPMVHPAYLLRTPEHKREAWADLLALKARLKGAS